MTLHTITLEEHYTSTAIRSQPSQEKLWTHFPDPITTRLGDLSPDGVRLQEMDSGNVSIQVISHSPGAGSSPAAKCSAANDELVGLVKAKPSRLAGFACLPMAYPEEAAKELGRCVEELGFVGALVDNHLDDGSYYDDRRFWVVFEKAQELDVPIYIHPTFPTDAMNEVLYKGNYNDKVMSMLGTAGFGWHQSTALHFLRLFAAGVFDEFPRLKLILGHMGELLPFQLERIEKFSKGPRWGREQDKRSLREVWDENLWITTSGMFSLNPLACMLRNTKVERILYSVDWPFSANETGWAFLQELRESGMVTEEQLDMIAYKNAEDLLKIKVQA